MIAGPAVKMATMHCPPFAAALALLLLVLSSGCTTGAPGIAAPRHELSAGETMDFRQEAEEVLPDQQELSRGVEQAYNYLHHTGALALAYEKTRTYPLRLIYLAFHVGAGYDKANHRIAGSALDAPISEPDFACLALDDRTVALVSNITLQLDDAHPDPIAVQFFIGSRNSANLYFVKVAQRDAPPKQAIALLRSQLPDKSYEQDSFDGMTVSVLIVCEDRGSHAYAMVNGPLLPPDGGTLPPVAQRFETMGNLFQEAWRLFAGDTLP